MNPLPDDPERDAWLTEALRHAPDAHAAPPPALSDSILRQAHAAANATRAPRPARKPGRWLAAWDSLARPSVAAGFASVVVATVVGVMWWDQPMDSTIARAPAATSLPQPAPPLPTPAPGATRATGAASALAGADGRSSPTAALSNRAAPMPPRERGDAAAAPGTAPGDLAPAPAPVRDRADPEPFSDHRAANDDTASMAAAPAATPAPAPAPALSARDPKASAASENKVDAGPAESSAMRGASALARSAAPKSSPPALPRADNATEAQPATLRALLAEIAARPERWGWERSGTLQPITPALQRWLERLDAATALARARAPAGTPPSGETVLLRLYRHGVLSATLGIDDESAGLVSGPRTSLPPATIAALKQGLDDATR